MKEVVENRISCIEQLYRQQELRTKILSYLQRMGAYESEVMDIFHDGLIILDSNIRNGKFRGESSLEGYLFSICKYLCLNKLRKNSRVIHVESYQLELHADDAVAKEHVQDTMVYDENQKIIEVTLNAIGESCKKVLTLWQLSYSMSEIAAMTGLSSAEMAKKKRYQCHKLLVNYIEKNNELKILLKEL